MSKNFRCGYLDVEGKTAIDPSFYIAGSFNNKAAVVKKFGKNKFSIIDREGKFIFEDAFDSFGKWSEGLIWMNSGGVYDSNGSLKGGIWTVVDDTGKKIIEIQCGSLYDFSEGLAGFVMDGRWGALDKNGKTVIEPKFAFLGMFSCGLAIANEGGLDGYIDKNGNWVIEPQFELAYNFTEDIGSVKKDGQFYMIDKSGKIFSEGYESVSVFQNKIAWVKKNGMYAFIDDKGKIIGNVWTERFKGTGSGLCGIFKDEKWFLMNKNAVLFGPYEDVLLPNENLARVMKNGRWGFIDLDGKEVMGPKYNSVYGFTEGFAGACEIEKWNFIDKKGEKINDEEYDYVGMFSENRGSVMKNGRWGLIDGKGNKVCDCIFGRIDGFHDGLAPFVFAEWKNPEPSYENNWTVMPKKGLSDKVFDGAGRNDVIRVIAGFSRVVEGEEYDRLTHIIYNWEHTLKASSFTDSVFVENDVFISNWNISFLISNVERPKQAVAALLEEIKEEKFPVNEVIFIRLEQPGEELKLNIYKKRVAVKHPDHDFGPWWYENTDSYLESVFDKNKPCPASETITDLIGVKTDLNMPEGMRFEERTMPLFIPGLRICYGVVQNIIVAADDRTYEIEDAIIKSFREKYSSSKIWVYPPPKEKEEWYIPLPLRNDNSIGVEKIEHEGRKGYLFAVEPYCIEQNFSSKYFRYREQEMMEALSEVIREKNLEEVITWQRFGDVPQNAVGFTGMAWPKTPNIYEINLWEKK